MTITASSIGSKGDTTARSTYTCAKATAGASTDLILVAVNSSHAATAAAPSSVSGGGQVFTKSSSVTFNTISTPTHVLSLWYSMGGTPDTSNISVDFGGTSQTGCAILVTRVSGVSTSGTSGVNAFNSLSTVKNSTSNITIFIPGFFDTPDGCFTVVGTAANATSDNPDANYVKLDATNYATPSTELCSAWTASSSVTQIIWTGSGTTDRACYALDLVADNPPPPGTGSAYYPTYYQMVVAA